MADSLSDRIIQVESGGDPAARNPRSSAMGAGQFIDATWLDIMSKTRPDLTTGKSREEILAMRADPALSRAMTEAYAAQNGEVLSAAGMPVTAGTTYLAHFAGPKGAVGVLSADPSTPVADVMGQAAVKANPFLAKMTVGDLRAWADRKMGVQTAPVLPPPITIAPAPKIADANAPRPPMPMAAPLELAAFRKPEFAEVASPFGSMSPEQMKPPPIQFARPADFGRLRAAFSLRG